jgi:hypothetical protein
MAGGMNLQRAAAAWANSKMEWEVRDIWSNDDKVWDSQGHTPQETSTQDPSIHITCLLYMYLRAYHVKNKQTFKKQKILYYPTLHC